MIRSIPGRAGRLILQEVRIGDRGWLVFHPAAPHADGPPSPRARVFDYPPNWRTLSDAELSLLAARATPARVAPADTTRFGIDEIALLREQVSTLRELLAAAEDECGELARELERTILELQVVNQENQELLAKLRPESGSLGK